MESFIKAYKRTGNSVLAYKETTNCDGKSLKEISDGSFSCLSDVFEEVDFYVSTDTKRGILNNTGKILSGIVSLGGSYMLEMHNKHYSDMYEAIYKPTLNRLKKTEYRTNESLSSIGKQLSRLNEVLKPVAKILKSKPNNASNKQQTLNLYSKFNSGFNTSLSVGFGGLVGGTTAIGAWGLVSLIGSASTGTAISSLSGVAATNATLAWFGGGSLATGGAGMVGGFWVLGGIVAAPIVFFTTKNSYKKVDTVKDQKGKLVDESSKLFDLKVQANTQLTEAIKYDRFVIDLMSEYIPKIERELQLYKQHSSFFNDLFGGKMNLKQEEYHNKLNDLTLELLDKLNVQK